MNDPLRTYFPDYQYQPEIQYVAINPDAIEPSYAHVDDSGADLYSIEDCIVQPWTTAKIHTGLIVALEYGWELQARTKGGPASMSIMIANSPGTIDEGFRGEVIALVYNGTPEPYEVKKGQKVAQAIAAPYWQARYVRKNSVEELRIARSDRGAGMLGSTGTMAK